MKYTQEQIQEEYRKVQEAWEVPEKDEKLFNLLAKNKIPVCIALVKHGREDLIPKAVKAGANPNAQDACGNTALHMSYLFNMRAVNYLNLLGADFCICNDKGEIPSDWQNLLKHALLNMPTHCVAENLTDEMDRFDNPSVLGDVDNPETEIPKP